MLADPIDRRATLVAFHHDRFDYPLPPDHRFPLGRYRLLRESLAHEPGVELREARAATDRELARAHGAAYLHRAINGELSRREIAALGLPWSARLVERARRSTGATIDAATLAMRTGAAVNLGGGTHHAAPDAGRGFCLFNDVVCAIRSLRATGALRTVAVIDTDVHQGDGTHLCLAGDALAVTGSVNGGRNYPLRRVPGDVEIDLADRTGDDEYLTAVAAVVDGVLARGRPELCFYLAGADPWEGDRLGRLAVSAAGLAERDRLVRDRLRAIGIPVVVVLAGGYGGPVSGTVAINAATVRLFSDG
ncbi:MAG TPA: histone deacetylase [Miltoncostaeaceae bacterium]|nr:histone deacetylase [Miltoncostaeaceae bacterium]